MYWNQSNFNSSNLKLKSAEIFFLFFIFCLSILNAIILVEFFNRKFFESSFLIFFEMFFSFCFLFSFFTHSLVSYLSFSRPRLNPLRVERKRKFLILSFFFFFFRPFYFRILLCFVEVASVFEVQVYQILKNK